MQKHEAWLTLMARCLLCLLFFYAALFNILNWESQVNMLTKDMGSLATAALFGATATEIVLGGLLTIGYQTRWSAFLSAAYTLICALTLHPFWTSAPAQQAGEAMHFFEDLGVIGGFLLIMVYGAGSLSLDTKLKKAADL